MTFDEFISKYDRCVNNINAPAYRGAPQPPFENDMINESAFSDMLRFKYVNYEYDTKNNIIFIDWESQGWPDDGDIISFIEEIKRCYNYLVKIADFKEPITIQLHIFDRDKENDTNAVIYINQ